MSCDRCSGRYHVLSLHALQQGRQEVDREDGLRGQLSYFLSHFRQLRNGSVQINYLLRLVWVKHACLPWNPFVQTGRLLRIELQGFIAATSSLGFPITPFLCLSSRRQLESFGACAEADVGVLFGPPSQWREWFSLLQISLQSKRWWKNSQALSLSLSLSPGAGSALLPYHLPPVWRRTERKKFGHHLDVGLWWPIVWTTKLRCFLKEDVSSKRYRG